jgi:hypothetical protein
LHPHLTLPPFCGAWCRLDGEEQPRLDRLTGIAEAAGAALLASGDVRYHHCDRRRLADALTAIRLGRTVESLGRAAERSGERETQHAGVPIAHLICRTLTDRTDLLNSLMHREANLPWGDAALGRADEVRRPDPGSRRPLRMPTDPAFYKQPLTGQRPDSDLLG